jgi:hypothetical protein
MLVAPQAVVVSAGRLLQHGRPGRGDLPGTFQALDSRPACQEPIGSSTAPDPAPLPLEALDAMVGHVAHGREALGMEPNP